MNGVGEEPRPTGTLLELLRKAIKAKVAVSQMPVAMDIKSLQRQGLPIDGSFIKIIQESGGGEESLKTARLWVLQRKATPTKWTVKATRAEMVTDIHFC